jgi:hypothetical protein
MELSITRNGAIYAVHPPAAGVLPTLRTSVGEFAMRQAQAGCYLELIVGNVHRILGLYQNPRAACDALTNRRTGFTTWDILEAANAKAQAGPLERTL